MSREVFYQQPTFVPTAAGWSRFRLVNTTRKATLVAGLLPLAMRYESVSPNPMLLMIANHPYLLFGLMLGGALASFACVFVERGKRNESLNGRSHCACGRQLSWYENVPVLGWVMILGKARCCGAVLSPWYVLTEVAGSVFCGLAGWFGAGWLGLSIFAVAALTWVILLKAKQKVTN